MYLGNRYFTFGLGHDRFWSSYGRYILVGGVVAELERDGARRTRRGRTCRSANRPGDGPRGRHARRVRARASGSRSNRGQREVDTAAHRGRSRRNARRHRVRARGVPRRRRIAWTRSFSCSWRCSGFEIAGEIGGGALQARAGCHLAVRVEPRPLPPAPVIALLILVIIGLERRWSARGRYVPEPRKRAFCAPSSSRFCVRLLWIAMVGPLRAVACFVRPDQRWLGGAIPIVFHCVLAAFLFVLRCFNAALIWSSSVVGAGPGGALDRRGALAKLGIVLRRPGEGLSRSAHAGPTATTGSTCISIRRFSGLASLPDASRHCPRYVSKDAFAGYLREYDEPLRTRCPRRGRSITRIQPR